jgi:hypothetical protein
MKEGTEYFVHECLECRGSISQTKSHHHKVEETLMGVECRLVDIFRAI